MIDLLASLGVFTLFTAYVLFACASAVASHGA